MENEGAARSSSTSSRSRRVSSRDSASMADSSDVSCFRSVLVATRSSRAF